MKYEIKNRFTGNTQFVAEIDCPTTTATATKKGLAIK
jgi:hypothetical protein